MSKKSLNPALFSLELPKTVKCLFSLFSIKLKVDRVKNMLMPL